MSLAKRSLNAGRVTPPSPSDESSFSISKGSADTPLTSPHASPLKAQEQNVSRTPDVIVLLLTVEQAAPSTASPPAPQAQGDPEWVASMSGVSIYTWSYNAQFAAHLNHGHGIASAQPQPVAVDASNVQWYPDPSMHQGCPQAAGRIANTNVGHHRVRQPKTLPAPNGVSLPATPSPFDPFAEPPPAMSHLRGWRAIHQAHSQCHTQVYRAEDGVRVAPEGWRVREMRRGGSVEYQMFPPRLRTPPVEPQAFMLDPGLEFREARVRR